jgi:hypothetical protein
LSAPVLRAASIFLALASGAQAEPARPALRVEMPVAVEAELMTRESLCRLDGLGGIILGEGALARSDLNQDGRDDYIVTLCRLRCAGAAATAAHGCDQSLIFLSTAAGYQPVRMPGELLDIRHPFGGPLKLLSSAAIRQGACPAEDGVCNPLYEVRGGELIEAGFE